jgi:hypothetical protein
MINGALDQLHFGDLLHWLQLGAISGRLRLFEGGRERSLDLLKGRVVYATSSVPDERLASRLARSSDIPIVTLQSLLALSLLRRTFFTDLVLENDLLSLEELRVFLTRQAERIMRKVLCASNVRFELDTQYPVQSMAGMHLDIDPNQLLLEAARQSDEESDGEDRPAPVVLPSSGEAFDSFFWSLAKEGVTSDEPLDGGRFAELQALVRNILGTLAQWLASSPGLVPLPSSHVAKISEQLINRGTVHLHGLPQATWNQLVLVSSVRSDKLHPPNTMRELERRANELDVWLEITGAESWHRPHADRLDKLTRQVSATWAIGAACAASHLGVEPEMAALAAHLLVVPTDLVLWVLTTLPVPHQGLRKTLLRQLPERVCAGLSQIADFPQQIRELIFPTTATPLGLCLHLGRSILPSASIWPATIPDDQTLLPEVATPSAITAATAAVRETIRETIDLSVAVG